MYAAFLEAAIVFARSVTFHLQKELREIPGFDEWYAQEQALLSVDPVAKYFLEQRNYILKQGSVQVRLNVGIALSAVMPMTGSLSFVVTRGQPWYRRSPRILVHDAVRRLRNFVEQWKQRVRAKRFIGRTLAQQRSIAITKTIQFADNPFNNASAIELLERYFLVLDGVLSRAEKRFP